MRTFLASPSFGIFLLLVCLVGGCSNSEGASSSGDSGGEGSTFGNTGGGTPPVPPIADASSTTGDESDAGDTGGETIDDVLVEIVEADLLESDANTGDIEETGNDTADEFGEDWSTEINDDCFYVPPAGAFQPIQECYWDDPIEYTQHDDVVMTPVVGNLNDDNFDGVVDLKDIPDIAFLSYRREEDGCCNVPSVLRVVSGSCGGGITHTTIGSQKLQQHFFIDQYGFDNSAGIALGDLNGDGQADLVTLRPQGKGTAAYTGALYAPHDVNVTVQLDDWSVVGTANPIVALQANPMDETSLLVTSTPEAKTLFEWPWGAEKTVAIESVRVVLHARAPGGSASIAGVIAKGTDSVMASAQSVGPDFAPLTFHWASDVFADGIQWSDDAVEQLQAGFVHAGPEPNPIEVAGISIVIGHVEQIWYSAHPQSADILAGAQPAITDLDGDGAPEVVIGRVVLDGTTGELAWIGKGGNGINSFMGPISIVADLDLDGSKEVIAGHTVYDANGGTQWTYEYPDKGTGCHTVLEKCDGFNATGNFDDDPEGEVVIVRAGVVHVLEHDGTLKAEIPLPKDNCSLNEGGPPTVADFDGDGAPEIGVAGADFYVVLDLDCCVGLPACVGIPPLEEQCESPGIRWTSPNDDCSSRVTGSSVFDFEGDGSAEVVYNDEKFFRIYSGDDGTILFEEPNTSHTRLEYPIIVDSDRDGNAEIVFIENGDSGKSVPIQVWGDPKDNWVPTRRIWNQHAYSITNISEDGTLPPPGTPENWEIHNNFRQNLPEFDPFIAPDLQIEIIAMDMSGCPASQTLKTRVCNSGQLFVGSGVIVRLFDEVAQSEIQCTNVAKTLVSLDPGECTLVECTWEPGDDFAEPLPVGVCVDDFLMGCLGPGWHNECDESNNQAEFTLTACP
jgi:hypothetical protein